MENLAGISEPQVFQMSKRINNLNFPSVYCDFNKRNAISPIKTE